MKRLTVLTTLAIALATGCASTKTDAPAERSSGGPYAARAGVRDSGSGYRYGGGGGGGGGWGAPANDPPRDARPSDGEPDMDRKLDSQKITCNFDGTPLEEAINFIRDVSGLNVAISAAAQERLDAERPKVTLRLREISVRNAIYHVLGADESLLCEVRSDMLVVSTRETAKKKSVTTFYDVTDIVDKRPDYPGADMGLPDKKGGGKGMNGAVIVFPGDDDKNKNKGVGLDIDKLVEIVQKLAGEDAQVEFVGGQLMVKTTESAHRRISSGLDGMRK